MGIAAPVAAAAARASGKFCVKSVPPPIGVLSIRVQDRPPGPSIVVSPDGMVSRSSDTATVPDPIDGMLYMPAGSVSAAWPVEVMTRALAIGRSPPPNMPLPSTSSNTRPTSDWSMVNADVVTSTVAIAGPAVIVAFSGPVASTVARLSCRPERASAPTIAP